MNMSVLDRKTSGGFILPNSATKQHISTEAYAYTGRMSLGPSALCVLRDIILGSFVPRNSVAALHQASHCLCLQRSLPRVHYPLMWLNIPCTKTSTMSLLHWQCLSFSKDQARW